MTREPASRSRSAALCVQTPQWLGALVAASAGVLVGSAAEAVVTAEVGSPPSADAPVVWRQGTPALALQGVARLDTGCSAVLLEGGRHLLGAAHCSTGVGGSAVLASGEAVRVAAVAQAPGWSGRAAEHDLALLTLEVPAVTAGYRIASVAAVDAAAFVVVAGFGASGSPLRPEPAGSLSWGVNVYEARMGFPGRPDSARETPWIRVFDFDDGSLGANTLGLRRGGHSDLGLGEREGMPGGMDSGGPSFIVAPSGSRRSGASAWRVAGIHVGIDARRGTAFGGLGLDLLPAPYAAWIEQQVGGSIVDPP